MYVCMYAQLTITITAEEQLLLTDAVFPSNYKEYHDTKFKYLIIMTTHCYNKEAEQ